MGKFEESVSELEKSIREKEVEEVDLDEEISEYLLEKDNQFLVGVWESNSIPDGFTTHRFEDTENLDSVLYKILRPFYHDVLKKRLSLNRENSE